jgi:hypothetical protein
MNTAKTIILLFCLSLTACKKDRDTQTNAPQPTPAVQINIADDKIAIDNLVKDMYVWNEKRHQDKDFETVVKDSMVVGYNMENHKRFLKELRTSGFFAEEFITNIDKIAQEQHKLLSSGKIKWSDGDLGPFDGDVNAWCGCQDEPAANAYRKITLHFEKIDNNAATFYWNWEGFGADWAAEHYNMRAVKENGKWKIAYMQGWDYAANLGVE